jgi:hypothetical protein
MLRGDAKRNGETKFLLRIFTRTWSLSPEQIKKFDTKPAVSESTRLAAANVSAAPPPAQIAKPLYFAELLPYIREAAHNVFFIEYVVKAYLYTGDFVTTGKKKLEKVVPVGSYGYVVRHFGQTEDWDFRIQGAQKIDATTYILRFPAGKTKSVMDSVRALKPPRWSFGLLAGSAFQARDFPGYKPGLNTVASAAFNICQDDMGIGYSLQALLGYDYLPAKGTTAAAWHVGSFTGLARFTFPFLPWVRPFLTMGGGAFLSPTRSIEGTVMVGTGIEIAPWYNLHFQLGIDMLGNTNKVIAQANVGLIYRIE